MNRHPLELKEKQQVYLNILKELDRYCVEHNLTYYMGCGTLIGAVRHKGFIPWDDDLDVFMPFPDYVRFAKEYHSERFQLHTCDNDMSHPFTFGLLCDNSVYSPLGRHKMYNFGIDIYVIYGAPSERKEQLKHIGNVFKYIKIKNLLARFRSRLAYHNLWPFRTLDFKLLNYMLQITSKELEKYSFNECEYIWPYGGGKLILKKELYGRPIRLPFEDGEFYAPQHYHEVLTAGYGDYMTPPPIDQRQPSHGALFYRVN